MKTFLLVFIIAFSVLVSNAQEQLPTTNKVSFGQDGKMFVNKDDGIFIWLSTSPDKDAQKHRLISESCNKFTNPMYFDTEGYNTVRSPSQVDTSTKKVVWPLSDIIFEVYADGQAPKSTLKKVKGTTRYKSGKLYGSNDIKYIVSAYDRVSGVENTYYSLNGNDYTIYTDTISITKKGENILKVYSTDRVGNREEPIELKLIID